MALQVFFKQAWFILLLKESNWRWQVKVPKKVQLLTVNWSSTSTLTRKQILVDQFVKALGIRGVNILISYFFMKWFWTFENKVQCRHKHTWLKIQVGSILFEQNFNRYTILGFIVFFNNFSKFCLGCRWVSSLRLFVGGRGVWGGMIDIIC